MNDYSNNGVCKLKLFSSQDIDKIRNEICSQILKNLDAPLTYDMKLYHCWWESFKDARKKTFAAKNRHFKKAFWQKIDLDLENYLATVIGDLVGQKLNIWDEGLGTTAFRLIRPGFQDGYPPSRKSWGPGGQLISATIPIIGFSEFESPGFILGSHLKYYDSYLEKDSLFCKEEKRLKNYNQYKYFRYNSNPGEVIIYHWDTIHTEQIIGKEITRLSLEMRFSYDS